MRLFANDILRLFVSSQPQEDRLAELVIQCPLGKFDLGDQHSFDPLAAFHDGRGNPQAPHAFAFLRQVDEWTGGLPDLFVLAAAKLTGEPDVLRSFFKQLSQEFAPGAERFFAQIFAFQEEQIKGKIDQRDITRAFEYLEKLERRATFLIQRSNFAVEDEGIRAVTTSGHREVAGNRTSFYCARPAAHLCPL
jgi:hypothetical protein